MTAPNPTEHYMLSFPSISGMSLNRRFKKRITGTNTRRSLSGTIGGTKMKHSQSISPDWAKMMHKDENAQVLSEKAVVIEHARPVEYFCTGCCYTGLWNDFGMSGEGVYEYYYGVQYDGEMDDGMFHGMGTLTFPRGHKMEGIWDKGKLVSFKYIFTDGLVYTMAGNYCKYPDRRFNSSMKEGLQPAPNEFLTNQQPTRKIPENCYDVGDGFYNPITKCVVVPVAQIAHELHPATNNKQVPGKSSSKDDTSEGFIYSTLSIPLKKEVNWIKANCRKAWDEPTGYRPDIYEDWTTGKAAEIEALLSKTKQSSDYIIGRSPKGLGPMLLRGQHETLETEKLFDRFDDLMADLFNVTDIKIKY